jgi:Zn-dependent M28 family amino/carboxypeptidase
MPGEWVAGAGQLAAELRVDGSELVFVGYGVRAPEYDWDDYDGVDVAGKTLLMLVNDPAVAAPDDPEALDPDAFRGKAMTYYGRWTYKYEIAGELGAAAVLVVHTTEAAGYDWSVVEGSFGRERFDLDAPELATAAAPVQGWVTHELFERLCRAGGHDPAELEASARTRDFRPVLLGGRASFALETRLRRIESRNVVGLLRGSEPALADELVVYTAHWDHLGIDPDLEAAGGDGIYNGALDNATGTGGVLELADGFARLPRAPRRSILFMLTTAEEKGLLGAAWYASHPLYPLEKTLANINIDGLNVLGRARDIQVVGDGNTTLEELLIAASVQQGRYVRPDSDTEKGYYYRSDHFEFAKRGVPALYVKAGSDLVGRPEGYGSERRAEYVSQRYHAPSDEVQPDWDYAGAIDDLWLLFRVGLNVANGARFPEWKPGTEFRARREAMLGTGG